MKRCPVMCFEICSQLKFPKVFLLFFPQRRKRDESFWFFQVRNKRQHNLLSFPNDNHVFKKNGRQRNIPQQTTNVERLKRGQIMLVKSKKRHTFRLPFLFILCCCDRPNYTYLIDAMCVFSIFFPWFFAIPLFAHAGNSTSCKRLSV